MKNMCEVSAQSLWLSTLHLVGKLEGKRPLERPRRRRRIILRWIIKKYVGVWAGLTWLRIGTGGGHF
jgi:hypothetical protein